MDNFFHNCPPMMEDQGRPLSDFISATRRDEYIKYVNNIWRDDEYRLFLQKNGKSLMDKEWNFHRTNNSCFPNACVHKYPTRSTQSQYIQEKKAFESIYNMDTKYNALKQCTPMQDYRLTN